jgi:anti-sigma regulatory factor (Ser/Thr protein kinase)
LDAWITLPAELASVEAARQWLLVRLAGTAVAPAALFRIELVLEELLMNVVSHGHPGERPEGFSVRLGLALHADHLALCLEDDGVPFDPSTAALPAAPATLADARVGGLGLVLVHKSARRLHHEREDGINRLWVELPLQPPAPKAG